MSDIAARARLQFVNDGLIAAYKEKEQLDKKIARLEEEHTRLMRAIKPLQRVDEGK